MHKLLPLAGALMFSMTACGADSPPANAPAGRPAPLTATILVVCEHGKQAIAVAVFTFDNGKTLIIDKDNPNGFTSAADIEAYAKTATVPASEYVQVCEGLST